MSLSLNSQVFFGNFLALGLIFALVWALSLKMKNAGIVDSCWAFSFIVVSFSYANYLSNWDLRPQLLFGVVALWALRLGGYILFRTLKESSQEDGRYKALREKWKEKYVLNLLWFFEFQALSVIALSLPFLLVILNPIGELHWVEWVSLGLCLVGILGETIADIQLYRFKSNTENSGKVFDRGLWSYSRHPNYFFEWIVWCGFGLWSTTAPFGYWGLMAPFVMYLFLTKVTGVPTSENQAKKTRSESYLKYVEEVPSFFPRFYK